MTTGTTITSVSGTARLLRPLLLVIGLLASASGCNCATAQTDPCKAVTCAAPADACHTQGTCDPSTGRCTTPVAADDTSCSDGNKCNGAEVCTAGVCGVKAGTAVTCAAPPACHTATGAACNPADGSCSYPALANDTSCSDGNQCNGDEVCTAGACGVKAGTVVTCAAPPNCRTAAGATCNPADGSCSYPAAPLNCNAPPNCRTAAGATCNPTDGSCSYPLATLNCNAPPNCQTAAGATCNPADGSCSYPAVDVSTLCTTPAACHTADGATCNAGDGSCGYPAMEDGTVCTSDGPCDFGFVCRSGACNCSRVTLGVLVLTPGGRPLAGASVGLNGDDPSVTNEDGAVSFNLMPGAHTVVLVEAIGYTQGGAVIDTTPSASFGVVVYLLPRADPVIFDADIGLSAANINDPDFRDAYLDVPGGSLIDPSGQPATGLVKAYVTALDPFTGQRAAAPGPFAGNGGDFGATPLESLLMAEIVLVSSTTGALLQPSTTVGTTLHFRLPASRQGQFVAGDSAPSWSHNPATGWWLQEGSGEIVSSDLSGDHSRGPRGEHVLEWRTTVVHFGWWNADLPIVGHSCVQVRALRAGAPVANVAVHASGQDYGGGSQGRTGPNGEPACLDVKIGGSALITADDPWLVNQTGQVPAVVTGATGDPACGAEGTCQTADVMLASTTCVSGRVLDNQGQPANGVRVFSTAGSGLGARGTSAYTGPDGSYCVEAPTHSLVRVTAMTTILPGTFAEAHATSTTGDAASACGSCTAVPDLNLAINQGNLCVKGRIFEVPLGSTVREPAAAGTPVYVFALNGGSVHPNCANPNAGIVGDPPVATWGTLGAALIATGAAGPGGRFCVDFPPSPFQLTISPGHGPEPLTARQQSYTVAPGDCDIRRRGMELYPWAWVYCGLDTFTPEVVDVQRQCELEDCIDVGDFDYGYLFDGSACYRQ